MTDTNKEAVELGLYDIDLTTKLSILPAKDVGLYFELNQPGSGGCKVHTLRSVASGLIQRGQFVRVTYRGAVQGGFFIEDIGKALASQGESSDLWTPISGRGPMMLLEDAVVWSDGTEASTLDFEGQPKAAMLIALIEEAKTRGTLSTLIYDFTASLDSDGNAWTDNEPMQFSVGKTLLDVAREIADFGVYFNVLVNVDGTFTLQAFADYGSDKSSSIYFRRGVNCTDITEDEQGAQIANALLIKHDGGYTVASDADSISAFRRREKLIDAIDAGNSANALTYGQALLEFSKEPKKEISTQMFDGMAPYVFTDYICGDWITLDTSGVEQVLRVRNITLSWADADKANVTVGLNTTVTENEIKMATDIRKLFEMWRRSNDGAEVRLPFWAAIGKLSSLATDGTAIYAMAVSDAGIMYIGGNITKVAGKDIGNAAAYNINTGEWSTLGTGFDGPVYAIACNGTDIYFGGVFTDADGTAVNNVCKYAEGTGTFSDMDSGVGADVRAIAIDAANDIVYVGGAFSEIGSALTISVAIGAWDDGAGTWSAMDGLYNSSMAVNIVRSISLSGTKVFIVAENVEWPSAGVAYWDTGTADWHAMGTGFSGSGQGYSSAVIGDVLYVGGNFTDADGEPNTANLAKWNITAGAFDSIDGGGANGSVLAMTVVNGKELVIGGAFTEVGIDALAAARIAHWNNGIWSLLGTGLNNTCHALTSYNGNIGAGGVFTQAGGKPIKFVGAYITSLEELVDYLETGGGASSSYTHPDHSGDVVSAGDGATTIQPNVVDNAKLVDMTEGTVKARVSAGDGDPEDVAFEDLLTAMGVPGVQTAKRVIISNASGVIGTTEALIYDDAAKTLSLGTTDAGSGVPNILAYLADGISTILNMFTWGTGLANRIKGVFARGTKSSPSAALADDVMLKVSGAGYDGTTAMGSAATSGEIRIVANQNQAAGAHGTRIEIWLAPNGSATMVKVGEFTEDGLRLETGYNLYMADDSKIDFGNGNFEMLQDNSVGGFDFGAANLNAGYFTVTTKILPKTNGGATVGQPSPLYAFSGYYLSSGGVINWNNGAVVLTQSGSVMTLSVGSFSGRIKKREVTVTQSATPSINTDNGDIFTITGLAQAITSLTSGLTGTPVEGDMIELQITDNGTARAITHGASFVSTTANAMASTTIVNKRLRELFQWNAVISKWECVGVTNST